MRRFVDLHAHTRASDGVLAPAELVRLAEGKRLAALAVTDHDTTEGLPEAAAAARGLPLRLIAGVEVSAPGAGEATMHILGLGIRSGAGPLDLMLRDMRRWRQERNPKILAKLRRLGVPIEEQELIRFAGRQGQPDPVISRLHIAKLLVAKRAVGGVDEAFERFLNPRRPAYVEKDRVPSDQVIRVIHASGGLALLAHPSQLRCGNLAQLERIVRDLIDQGLDGIEVYHSEHTLQQTRAHLDLARRFGLLVGGGSDFHGQTQSSVRLGRPAVPVAAVRQLLARLSG